MSRFLQSLLLALVILATHAAASGHQSFENISTDRDLFSLAFKKLDLFGDQTVGRIQAITQGPDGFMWIGTHQGLFRFDGQRIQAFRHDEYDNGSLPDDSIWSLHFDSKNRLWVGTLRGLAKYNPLQENFTSYLTSASDTDPSLLNQVNAILDANNGYVFASTEYGIVYRYDEEVDTFSPVNGKAFGAIKSMTLDDEYKLWIGTDNAISSLDLKTGERKRYTRGFLSTDGVTSNYITSIAYVNKEEIWVGTTRNGLVILNPLNEETTQIPYSSQPQSYINQVSYDGVNHIWTATNAGISVYDRSSRKLITDTTTENIPAGIPRSGVTALWVDHQGSLWIGSNYDGISRSSRPKNFEIVPIYKFNPDVAPQDPVSAFLEDRNGNLWVGHPKSGVTMYPKEGGPIKTLRPDPNDPKSLTDQPVLSMLEDSRGLIWIGTYRGGLYKYDPTSDQLKAYLHDPLDPYSISGHDIRHIVEDSNGDLWIATHGSGISRLDTETERFYNHRVEDAKTTGFNILNDWVNAILVDDEQRLWLCTSSGISRISADRTRSKIFRANKDHKSSLSSSQVNHIVQDSKGRIWIATKDGLNLYLPESENFKSYKTQDGLPHQNISSIVEDDSGVLWMGTLDGLARFDPQTESIKTFHTSDGLASNDFFEASGAKMPDGTLYFGQHKGLIRFKPSEIKDDTHIPNVFITGILALGSPLEIDPDNKKENALTKSVLFTDKLELTHELNSLTFEFVAIDYINPSENEYRYKLEGFDQDWTTTKKRTDAVYTNLNPGDYVFRVQAANKDGYWNESGDAIAITISPPYWDTIWFKLLVASFLLALPSIFILWNINKIKKDARLLERAVNERTADLQRANRRLEESNAKVMSQGEILERTVKQRTKELEIAKSKAEHSDKLKSAFLANMSHEIRTPMNAIIGFLHILDNKDLTETEREQFSNIIQQSSKSLMSLIDDILDLSAIEAGEAEISPQPCNVEDICEELAALFRESLSKEKGEKVSFRLAREVPKEIEAAGPLSILIDPLRLKQILWNLISNSIKFTDEGEIRLGYRVYFDTDQSAKPRIQFTVQDTGIGIPTEEHKQIFNRFHKLDKVGKKLYRGTGLGLTITKTLTDLMDGHITVESTPNVGTTFRVTFPFNQVKPRFRPTIQPATANPLDVNLKGFNLLVVEDETPNFEYIERVLKRTGATIHWADNGRAALDLFEAHPIDLVLLDLKIPEIDGYEVARRIRTRNKTIPIIAQSAYAMREDHLKSSEAGANEHLAKPFSPDRLIETLSRYLVSESV